MMTVMGLTGYENQLFVITHSNITLRKLAEIKLESLAQQDPLTGLANRRHFHSYMDLEWNRCRRDQTPISLIMFDIDHFKSINDTYGHTTGDVCLTTVANVIGTFARRPYDLAVRWGGEEFILALAGTTHPTALQIADQIRVTIEQLDCSDYGHCTVSAGVASAIPVAGDYSGLIQQVDEALYSAKETGRNKVVSFEELHH
jgi:diguanylate cyclase (GGDEF)-like protein